MESQILTFCLGLGGWMGVLFSVGAFMINNEPLGFSVLAKHSVFPFVSAGVFTAIVQFVRFVLMALNMITAAMLNRFIIMNFLQILTSLITGVVMGAAYYNLLLPSLKDMFPVDTGVEEEEDAGSEMDVEQEEDVANDGTTETSDVTEDVSGGDDTEHSSDKTEDEHADDESEVSVYVPPRKWWPF